MPRTIEEILKARGYTDADLEAAKPLLGDAKFRGALEGSIDELDTKLTKAESDNVAWSDWHQKTALPTLDKALKGEQDARSSLAGAQARLKTLQEQGLIKVAEGEGDEVDPAKKAAAAAGEPFDPKKHNLVTRDDVAAFADQEGDAIAMAQDLSAEYQELYGKPLRNFRELRKEAIAAKVPVQQYIANKFKFQEKHAEIDAADRKKYEEGIRADERSKTIAEVANPMARPPSSSRHPFTARPAGVEAGKQPWENPEGRTQERVNKALKTVLAAQ
jgi:hypothetical protein